MKRFTLAVLAIAGVVVMGAALAGELNYIPLAINNVNTNATAVAGTTNTYDTAAVNGMVEGIFLQLTGTAAKTCTVTVATSATGESGTAQTLLTLDATTASSGYYPVRKGAVTSANVAITDSQAPFVLLNDTLKLVAYDADVTNMNLRALVVTR